MLLLPLLLACAPHHLDAPLSIAIEADHRVEVRGAQISAVDPAKPAVAATVLRADRVTAGFVDAHTHPEALGRSLAELDLSDAATYADVLARVRAASAGEAWLQGRGWDQNDWDDAPAGGWPLAADLDRVTGARPALLRRVDGHAVWANSAALAAAGVTATTPDPAGGKLVRDAAGVPTGVLIDAAMDLVRAPAPSHKQRRAWLIAGLDRAAEVGLTGVHVMWVDDEGLALYDELARADALPLRVWLYLAPDGQGAERLLTSGPWLVGWMQVVGLKAFADGALGSRGALLTDDYSDAHGERGLAVEAPERLADLATRALGAHAQLAVHAIGDAGVSATLDAFAAARSAHPDVDVPLRVEHAQVIRPDDLQRFNELHVIASMQPTHATSDMGWAEARLGPERVRWAYAWATVLDQGIPLAFGSDFPVEAPDPGLGMWSATTRMNLAGEPPGGWYPAERLTTEHAARAFTEGPANAVNAGDHLGQLAPGYDADLTLWRVEATPWGERWHAVGTVVGGRAAHASE